MNHYALYIKLMEHKLPTQLLTVLESWLNTCTTCIRWNGRVSHCFSLAAGVRRGVLSPFLLLFLLIQLLKGLKHLMFAAILFAFAAVFVFTPMMYCYLLLQSLNYGHYYVLVKTI